MLMDTDTNMKVAGMLSDLAAMQSSTHSKRGYERASFVIRSLPVPIESLLDASGVPPKLPGIGPSSTRVILEVLRTGDSATVGHAIEASGRRDDIARRREWQANFLSAAQVASILDQPVRRGLKPGDYQGDLQMHSTWSDGSQSLAQIVETGIARGYAFAAVTDHTAGLPIARGVSIERFARQAQEIDDLNDDTGSAFCLLKGVEANILADGGIDVAAADRQAFDIIVAAPHSDMRSTEPQTKRMLAAVRTAGVHILGHPRGRKYGSRPGVSADWSRVFAAAREAGVAIEIDGDPSRQDLDYVLAREALDAGCLFALDSDAHSTAEWSYTDTALAHAMLAGIPRERIVNCWPLDRLLTWARERQRK